MGSQPPPGSLPGQGLPCYQSFTNIHRSSWITFRLPFPSVFFTAILVLVEEFFFFLFSLRFDSVGGKADNAILEHRTQPDTTVKMAVQAMIGRTYGAW